MSEQPQPTDRELLAAVDRGDGVAKGRALYAARHAMQRYRDPNSNVSTGRDLANQRARRRGGSKR